MAVHFQQAFTGAPYYPAALGAAICSELLVRTTACFELNDCSPTMGQQPLPSGTAAFFSLAVVLGSATLASPLCPASTVLAAAVVQSDLPFATVPTFRLAALTARGAPAPSALSSITFETLNATLINSKGASVAQQLWLAVDTLSEGAVPEMSRGIDGSSTVHCSIPDVSSFDRVQLNALEDVGQLFSPDCIAGGAYSSGADLQAACVAEPLCLAVVVAADERPLCLLRSGRGTDPFQDQDGRWLMTKAPTANRTCAARAINSGTMSVLLRQTSLSATTVVVFIGNAVVAQCGGPRPFTGGVYGRSSACGTWMTCFEGRVLPNDTVRVVYSATASAGGCDGSVGVLFSAQFDAGDQTRAPEPRIPLTLAGERLQRAYPNRLLVKTSRRAVVNVFVHEAEELVLRVAQTGFSCSRASNGICTIPAVQLLLGGQLAQECGGTLPFFGNVSGTSDQCSQPRLCGFPISVSSNGTFFVTSPIGTQETTVQDAASSLFEDGSSAASGSLIGASGPSGYTGWVTLAVDISLVRHASALCPYFAATLHVSSGQHRNSTDSGAVSGFVLHAGRGEFVVLVAPRAGSAVANASVGVPLLVLSAVLGTAEPRVPALFQTSPAVLSWPQIGGVNASFACIMDWISSENGVCIFPVPPGANTATIRIAQTNFASPENVMTVASLGGSGAVLSSAYCGGSYGFSGQPSSSERCTTFLPCGGGFIDSGVASIRLTVPSAVGNSVTCAVAFVATVDFGFVNRTVPTFCPFLCARDRTCVDQSAVCNGVVECNDGSDEEACNAWSQVESNYMFEITPGSRKFDITVFSECRTAALRNATTLFSVARNQTLCVVYAAAKAAEYLLNPTPYILAEYGMTTFALLRGGATYGRCTSEGSCSSQGNVIETRSGSKILCSCVCNSGFTGPSCAERIDLGSTGPISVSFLAVEGDAPPDTAPIEAALQLLSNSTDVAISCSPIIRDQAQLVTACKVSGPSEDVKSIKTAASENTARKVVATALNISEDKLSPMIPSTQPLFQDSPCGGGNSSSSSSCPIGKKPLKQIRVSLTAGGGVDTIVVVLLRTSGQRRRFVETESLRCVADNNNLFETPTRSGCVTTVCFVTAENSEPVDSVSVTTPTYVGNSSTDPCYSLGLSFTVPLLVTDIVKANPIKHLSDYSPFLISGIVVLVLGGILLGVASFAVRWNIAESSAAIGSIPHDHALKSLLTDAIRRMKFNHVHNTKKDRWGTALGVASFDMLILGIFLALYFVNSSGYTSNVQVLIESYRTESCERSSFASLAKRVTIVPPTTSLECLTRESTGVSEGSMSVAAYCDNSTGTLSVLLKIGSSKSECETMPFTRYPVDVCIAAVTLLSQTNDSSYLRFQCGTLRSVEARFAAFQALNANDPDTDTTRLQVPGSLAQPSASGELFTAKRMSLGASNVVASKAVGRFESGVAGDSSVDSMEISSRQLVIQVESEVFEPSSAGAVTSAMEQLSQAKSVGSAVAALGPQDGDYPVGFLYNNFNVPGEASLFAAGVGAARYYGIRGSSADIGLHYGGGPFDGFTISMYLRCTRRTAGFAFAVADAREDMVSGLSPLLTRLMTIIENGSPASAWYNSTYNVYSGLFVDGPGMSLHFVYANSQNGPELSDLRWDLASLGLTRLLNGLWHHVAIIIRSENQNTKLQLVVDGETSESKNGWNQCAVRTPEPIQSLDLAMEVAVRNFQAERVLSEGVLFAGYFNGGVAHLQFINKKVELFDMWRTATRAIQSHNAVNESKYIALGSVLVTIGILMIVIMLVTSGKEWFHEERSRLASEELEARGAYKDLWRKVPVDACGAPYAPLPFSVALERLECTTKLFTLFIEELKICFRHPQNDLVRLLYAKAMAGTADIEMEVVYPTAAEWQALLPQSLGSATEETGEPDEGLSDQNGSSVAKEEQEEEKEDPAETATAFVAVAAHHDHDNVLELSSSQDFGSSVKLGSSVMFASSVQFDAMKTRGVRRNSQRQAGKVDVKISRNPLSSRASVGGVKGSKQFSGRTGGSAHHTPKSSEMVQSVLGVIQSVSVWQTSLKFPQAHLAAFQIAFSAFSLDFSSLVSLSPLVTPLVQLFVGLVVFGVLLFVVEADEKAFLWNLARYVVVRDRLDMGSAAAESSARKIDYMSEVDQEFDSLLGEVIDNGVIFSVSLLPLGQSQRIDAFLSGDKRRKHSTDRAILVRDDDAFTYTVQKPPSARDDCPVTTLYVKSYDTTTRPLRPLGHCCALHTSRMLAPQEQTDVWPYKFRPTCCAERNGSRCGESIGLMYVCKAEEEKQGKPVQCKYAVCEKHFRAPAQIALVMPLVGLYRAALERGVLWLVVTIFLVAANAFYTPFMKTALSILACDPFYQCQFTHCWEAPDRLFILAAYLCFVIVIFYGLGFPLCMVLLLRRRRQMLHEIFFSDVYEGRFEDPSEAGQVDMEEWRRYVVTDPTALGKLYLSFELDWIYVPPILLFWKAAVLAPAVFIERNTFQQSVGVATAQFLFGVFMFVTEPSISPIVDLMYKLGAAHQMLLLGVLSLNTRQQYVGAADLGALSVAITIVYLLISVAMLAGVTVIPTLQQTLHERRITELLAGFGMPYSKTTGMYVVPSTARALFVDTGSPGGATEASPTGSYKKRSEALAEKKPASSDEHPLSSSDSVVEKSQPAFSSVMSASENSKVQDVDEAADSVPDVGDVENDTGACVMLKDALARGLASARQSNEVTPLQRRLILAALAGIDCVVTAPTGAGKSQAAAVIALQSVDLAVNAVQVLILCRDPQAAQAFTRNLRNLGSELEAVSVPSNPFVLVVDGSSRPAADTETLHKYPGTGKIVVGTVEAIARVLHYAAVRTERVAHLVLDDVLESNSLLHGILRDIPEEAQRTVLTREATADVNLLVRPTRMSIAFGSLPPVAPDMLRVQSLPEDLRRAPSVRRSTLAALAGIQIKDDVEEVLAA
jgi:hypothetical protein